MRWLNIVSLAVLLSGCAAHGLPAQLSAQPCDTCVFAVRALEDFLCDAAATDFLVKFVNTKVCPIVGDSPKCHNLAEGLIPVAIDWFRSTATPALLCKDAGVCGAQLLHSKQHNTPSLRLHKDTSMCSMCTYVVTSTKKALNDTAMQEKVKEAALQICSDLPADLAASCTDFVNTYEPLITNFINSVEPKELCELIGACMQQLVAHTRPPPPLPATLVRVITEARRRQATALWEREQSRQAALREEEVTGPANDACDICKMAVIEAHTLIMNPVVQSDIVNYTKALCETMGPSYSDVCKEYVDIYAPAMFQLLEQYLVPDQLCGTLGICPVKPLSVLQQLRAALGSALAHAGLTLDPVATAGAGEGDEALAEAAEALRGVREIVNSKYSSSVFREWAAGKEQE